MQKSYELAEWANTELRRLLPGWYVALLLRTRSRQLARLTGIEIHYFHSEHGCLLRVEITQRGKVRASRTV